MDPEPYIEYVCAWFGNSTVQQRKQLDKIVRTASRNINCELTSISEIYANRTQRKWLKILQDPTHRADPLLVREKSKIY